MENETYEIIMDYILKNGIVVNEGSKEQKDILIKNGKIQSIGIMCH